MHADTYIPRRLDDQWKIVFWDVDVAAPLLFGLFMGYLIARKFNDRVSIQLSPTFLHRNKTESQIDENDVFGTGIGGRFKLSKRTSFNAEYFYTVKKIGTAYVRDPQYKDCLSLGFDIETGGHVFQLHLSNSRGMIENQFIGATTESWGKGDIFYGFNISRVFSFDRDAKKTHK